MEQIYNLFYYVDNDIITKVGAVAYKQDGSDDDKIKYLQSKVEDDYKIAQLFELPDKFKIKHNDESIIKGIDVVSYLNMCSQGHDHAIFNNVIDFFKSKPDFLSVITPIIDGNIKIDGIGILIKPMTREPEYFHVIPQEKWYNVYIDDGGFHLDQLINDDYFEAIRILFNAKQYVSSIKLLMICIDTMSYLEFGDIPQNFQNWLQNYTDLNSMNIQPDELKEFRNSVLHMTNLDSRKVLGGKIRRLMFYVGNGNHIQETHEAKYFNFKEFIEIIAQGIKNWGLSYYSDKDKFEDFVDRYDRIISDKRLTYTYNEKYFDDKL